MINNNPTPCQQFLNRQNIHQLAVVAGFLNLPQGILKNNQLLADVLGLPIQQIARWHSKQSIKTIDGFAGWGRKKSYHRAKALADKYQKPIITLEDGFLRSIDSGVGSRYAVSYIADDLGVYFDLTAPSRLEHLIIDNIHHWNTDKQHTAQRLINKIINHKLSKYNASITAPSLSKLANNDKAHIIIIDQVKHDCSISGAGADEASFVAMLNHAKATYPKCNIWIKAHPAGKGYFKPSDFKPSDNIFYLKDSCNSMALLEQAQAVYTVSSHMGFEALMLNKTVHCFGVAWYSGFGLTDDSQAPQELLKQVITRRKALGLSDTPASIAQLFFSAYIDYSYYADPASRGIGLTACDIDTAIDWLITNRNHALRLQGAVLSYDLSRWKSGFVAHFLGTPLTQLTIKPKIFFFWIMPKVIQDYFNHPKKPYKNKPYRFVLAWGMAHANRLKTSQAYQNTPILCMEDGFIRSKGLGATLLEPLSVVLDGTGIYYNARYASDLETLLVHASLNDETIAQTQALLHQLDTQRITKYNVGNHSNLSGQIHTLKQQHPNAKVRLVVGQVEDDASVQNCLSSIKTNGKLLQDVHARHPNDIIIYKPHPDVEAGLRQGVVTPDILTLAQIVAHDTAMPDCLDVCDVVYTISSLTGFEALIRGKSVVCYGLPFYAGFGLTQDIINNGEEKELYQNALARRQRPTPLDVITLAHTTLIAYPLYRLPHGIGLAKASQVVDYLANPNTIQDANVPTFKKTLKRKFMQWRHKLTQK